MMHRGLTFGLLVGCAAAAAGEPTQEIVRAFYFGNSLTGATMPDWHSGLGASAGRTWQCAAWLGAGWQLWQHREALSAGRDLFGAGSKGDLTIDANLIKSAPHHAKRLHNEPWDAVVLQLFGQHVSHVTDRMWGRDLGGRKDVGDLAAAADLARFFLNLNPKGRVFVYQVWPPMDAGEVPPPEQLPDWAKRIEKLRAAEFPDRASFDYAARWLQPYAPTDQPWTNHANRTRDFSARVFGGLQEAFPELWREGRLRMIPAGDLFLELDRRMRAGGVPGCRDIRDFYADVQHLRFGLPRYTVAALFFACLFEAPPDRLDGALYGDRANYGADPFHDGGDLLPITSENAAAVNAAIRDTLRAHPFVGGKERP